MSAPRVGTRGTYQSDTGPVGFLVKEIEGNLCYADYDNGTRGPFIWRFPRDGTLNSRHDWPGKEQA